MKWERGADVRGSGGEARRKPRMQNSVSLTRGHADRQRPELPGARQRRRAPGLPHAAAQRARLLHAACAQRGRGGARRGEAGGTEALILLILPPHPPGPKLPPKPPLQRMPWGQKPALNPTTF